MGCIVATGCGLQGAERRTQAKGIGRKTQTKDLRTKRSSASIASDDPLTCTVLAARHTRL